MVYFWLCIAIIALVLEAATPALITIWFIPAALVSMVLAIFRVPIPLQGVVFFLTALVMILLFRSVLKKRLKKKPLEKTNADLLLGEEGVVTEEINNLQAIGQVKVSGQIWSARTKSDDVTIPCGTIIRVLEIQGVKLIVTPAKNQKSSAE